MSIPYDYDPLGIGNRGGDEGYIVFSDGVRDYRLSGNFDALTDGNWMLGTLTSESVVKPRLTEWSIALPNLTKGDYMFTGRGLTSFSSDLPSLTSGNVMFQNCKLDETSVLRILNSIPSYSSGSHPLHLGKRTNYLNSTEIATLLGTTTPIAAASNYSYKGWTIIVTS